MVTHLSINRARRTVTSLIETNALPLSQTATRYVYLVNLLWLWPWPNDLDNRPWPRYSEDVLAHQKWSFRQVFPELEPKQDRQKDT